MYFVVDILGKATVLLQSITIANTLPIVKITSCTTLAKINAGHEHTGMWNELPRKSTDTDPADGLKVVLPLILEAVTMLTEEH